MVLKKEEYNLPNGKIRYSIMFGPSGSIIKKIIKDGSITTEDAKKWFEGDYIYLKYIRVDKEHRKKGIGSALITYLKILAEKENIKYIFLVATFLEEKITTDDLLYFYKKNGAREVSKNTIGVNMIIEI